MGRTIGEKQVSRGVDFKTLLGSLSAVYYTGALKWSDFSALPPQKTLLPKTGAQMSWQSIGDCGSLWD